MSRKPILKIKLLWLFVTLFMTVSCSTTTDIQDLDRSPCENSDTEEQIYQKRSDNQKNGIPNTNIFVECQSGKKPFLQLAILN